MGRFVLRELTLDRPLVERALRHVQPEAVRMHAVEVGGHLYPVKQALRCGPHWRPFRRPVTSPPWTSRQPMRAVFCAGWDPGCSKGARRPPRSGAGGNTITRTPTPRLGTGAHPGNSAEQQEAERLLIERAGAALGVRLTKARVRIPEGGWLEIDGLSESPPVLCETWAHVGPAKSAQKHKLMADTLKLLYAALFYPKARKVLVLADREAARHLRGTGWMARALHVFKVAVIVADVPAEIRARLIAAQRRQYR